MASTRDKTLRKDSSQYLGGRESLWDQPDNRVHIRVEQQLPGLTYATTRKASSNGTPSKLERRHAISDSSRSSAQGANVIRRRCARRQYQLVSRSLFPIERQTGSRTSTPSGLYARRSRATGQRRCLRSCTRCAASSRALWQPQEAQSLLKRSIVSCQRSSGSATSCSMCFDRA